MSVSGYKQAKIANQIDQFLNFDFCPWANRWVYWMKHPLVGIVVVCLAAAICGMYVAPQAWLLCLGLFVVAGTGLFWPAISIWAVKAEIQFDKAWVEEQTSSQFRVVVKNRLPIPVWGLSLAGGVPGEELLASFSRVPSWRSSEYIWQFTPQQRGVYPQSEIVLQTGFPFGVWTAKKPVDVRGNLIVFPKPVALDAVPDLQSRFSPDELFSDRHPGDAGDVTGTRAFREGDSLRRVHWATTARTGKLICTERQASIQRSLTCALDVNSDHHRGLGPESSLEWSIRIFAGICRELSNQGIHVQAIIGAEHMQVQGGKQGFQRLLMKLARLPQTGISNSHHQAMSSSGIDISVLTDLTPSPGGTLRVQLEAGRFEETTASEDSPVTGTLNSRYQVIVEGPEDLPAQLRQNWRRLCHAAS